MPRNTPNLHSDSYICGYISSIKDDSFEHYGSIQQEESHTFKKIKLNEDFSAFNKMDNSQYLQIRKEVFLKQEI
ncbi:unnamed protein product [Paramecium sonneborni]|uniref:Uncharacterized protein n=1 Tax=Paramecium sonneborni TaxID=65129 RepID=A0A8S1RQF0_9CILI|nr:unnamed protein product [Paramecium sonneborni]